MLKSLEKRLGRTRRYVPECLKTQVLKDVLQSIDLENTEEVVMGAYMGSNVLHGRRAIDQFFLDWANVTWHEAYQALSATEDEEASARAQEGGGAASEQPCCGKRGLGIHHQTTKNNRPQVEKGPKPLYCVTGCDRTVKRTQDGKLAFTSFCPVHFLLHAKALQARDAGVSVSSRQSSVDRTLQILLWSRAG